MKRPLSLVFLLLLTQLSFAFSPVSLQPAMLDKQMVAPGGEPTSSAGFAFFQVTEANPGIALNWQWQAAEPAKYFMVERQAASGRFETVGGIRQRDQDQFHFTDLLAQTAGLAAYRIKAVLPDGRVEYSTVQHLKLSRLEGLQLYPNPSSDQLTLAYDWQSIGSCSIDVFNQQGQRVLHQSLAEPLVQDRIFLDLQPLEPGLYFLQVHSQQGDFAGKFVKQ
jgi:hypothetical protein